jgi:hypothetical protein
MDAAQAVHEKFLARLDTGRLPDRAGLPDPAAVGLDPATLADIYETQLTSRQMDRLSRTLQARGEGFYTIGSSGHEGNAALAAALRLTDMAFLHYRSNAFQLQRARQLPGTTPTWDMLLSFAASAEDPISGGRHKVIGSKPLFIPPQTSTIASHLPKAVGAAFSIPLARRLKLADTPMPDDAIVGRSTRRGGARFRDHPSPSSFAARIMASAFRRARPPGGSRHSFSIVRGCIMSVPPASTSPMRGAVRGRRQTMHGVRKSPCFCTWKRCGFMAMPGRTCN